MSKKNQHREQAALVAIHVQAQNGEEEVGRQLRGARRVVGTLLESSSRYTGKRHEHLEPYEVVSCGWCSNIRHWRWSVAFLEVATPLSEEIEARVKALATGRTQATLWAAVQYTYPRMRRDLARQLWRQAREG